MIKCYSICDTEFYPQRFIIPYSPQQLVETLEATEHVLPEKRSEYTERNSIKNNDENDDDDDDDNNDGADDDDDDDDNDD